MSWLDDLLGKTIQKNGTALPDRKVMNFIEGDSGVAITVTDNPGTGATDVEFSGGVLPDPSSDPGTVLYVDGGGAFAFGVVPDTAMPNLTGDVTTVEGAVATTIANNAVSNAKLRDSAALSVIGRSANSSGDPADIAATPASGAVLRESGSVVGFGTIVAAGIASDAVTTAKILDANVTKAKIENSAGLSVIGRGTNSTGVTADITGVDGQLLRVAGTALAFGQALTAGIADNAITLAKLATQAALSVLANATNGTAVPTAVAAATDGHIFRRSGTALAFGKILTNFITGTATNDSATAGDIGELISSSVVRSAPVALVSATAKTVTSIALTAGDWDLSGCVGYTPATTRADIDACYSTTTNVLTGNDDLGIGRVTVNGANLADVVSPIPTIRVSLSGTTTYYLIGRSTFTGASSAYGSIRARRVR